MIMADNSDINDRLLNWIHEVTQENVILPKKLIWSFFVDQLGREITKIMTLNGPPTPGHVCYING
jgi:hypothetical protein